MDTIIIQNLIKTFGLPKKQELIKAIDNISFSVQKGEIFGILGPNGAGKTTTLEIIEGLNSQTSGVVRVLGFDTITQSGEIKKRIGVQLQSSEYLPSLSLGELLTLFASLYGQKANVQELLTLVNLQEKEHTLVKNLSGGQKQRFTIATSLVNNPEIIFLDEPTTGLDPAARRNLWDLVKTINARGITVVLTTHYMEEAEFLCHRVAIMDRGEILKIDEPKKLIEQLSHGVKVSFLVNGKMVLGLESMEGVKKSYIELPKVILELKALDYIGNVLQALKDQNISFSGFTVKTASLEDVYLQLTGKEYQE